MCHLDHWLMLLELAAQSRSSRMPCWHWLLTNNLPANPRLKPTPAGASAP